MEDEGLSEYVSRSERQVERSPQMDEANTKVRLVQPFVSLLGWDIHSSEVELEYPVQMGAGTKKVDYALMMEDTPVIFIEAKGCDTPLNDSHRNQLTSYMRIVGVDWGVLTNGKQFEILKRRPKTSKPDEITLGKFSIDGMENKSHVINALSKESIETGEAETIAENIERIQKAIKILQENKDRVADRILDVVTDEVGETLPVKIENDAKEFVDDLIVSLESHGSGSPISIETNRGKDKDYRSTNGFWEQVEDELGIIASEEGLILNQDLNAVENFIAFIEFLLDEGYLTKRDLPYNPGGPKRYLINTKPTHIDESEMFNPHEIADGIFIETHNSTSDKKRFMVKLAEDFADTDQVW